jgi:hypothetical protein
VDEDCELELESPIAVLGLRGAGATRISTISNRASEATTTDQAVRPISAVLRVCWFLSRTWTSKLIRSGSTFLSSWKDSLAISIACWRCKEDRLVKRSFSQRQEAGRNVRRMSRQG